jgi:Tol biopolymer transport system component
MLASAGLGAQARGEPAVRPTASPSAVPANGESDVSAISADGRFVVFSSVASNLVAGDTNGSSDVFVRDLLAGTTQRVSVSSSGEQANGGSGGAAISADGRFVVFTSAASNLVAGDTNGRSDVFVRDLVAGTTDRVSVSNWIGEQANGASGGAEISADGRFVVFNSDASNLVAGDTSGDDVFVRDLLVGTTALVSVSSTGEQASSSYGVAISADGRFVAFDSYSSNLVGETNAGEEVFVRDLVARTTEPVSVSSAGEPANGSQSVGVAISADGRFVVFSSNASNLVAGDTNGAFDVFVRDLVAGTTARVSVSSTGEQAEIPGFDGGNSLGVAISADGRFVVFLSEASNLVAAGTNGWEQVFVRDLVAGTTELVSVSSAGEPAIGNSQEAAISADGRFVAFQSDAPNLVAGDTNGASDVFVHDMEGGTTTLVSVRRSFTPRAGRLLLQPWPASAGKQMSATMRVSAGGSPVARARVLRGHARGTQASADHTRLPRRQRPLRLADPGERPRQTTHRVAVGNHRQRHSQQTFQRHRPLGSRITAKNSSGNIHEHGAAECSVAGVRLGR